MSFFWFLGAFTILTLFIVGILTIVDHYVFGYWWWE